MPTASSRTVLWDFVNSHGNNELQRWAEDERLGPRERAQLNQKLDMLERISFDTAIHLQWLAGTSGPHNHVYKLRVKSLRQLRPMVCRGPLDMGGEMTLLCGAIEKDYKLIPANAAEIADGHRESVRAGGEPRRTTHRRF